MLASLLWIETVWLVVEHDLSTDMQSFMHASTLSKSQCIGQSYVQRLDHQKGIRWGRAPSKDLLDAGSISQIPPDRLMPGHQTSSMAAHLKWHEECNHHSFSSSLCNVMPAPALQMHVQVLMERKGFPGLSATLVSTTTESALSGTCTKRYGHWCLDGSSLTPAGVKGIIAGCVLFIVLVAVGVTCWIKKRRQDE